jgi:hypothetical protein
MNNFQKVSKLYLLMYYRHKLLDRICIRPIRFVIVQITNWFMCRFRFVKFSFKHFSDPSLIFEVTLLVLILYCIFFVGCIPQENCYLK